MKKSNPRRGYRSSPGNGWLLEQTILCFRNFARNWKGDIDDADVFNLFDSGSVLDERTFTGLLDRHLDLQRLEKLGIVELPPGEEDGFGIEEPPPPRRGRRSLFRRNSLPVEFGREPSNTLCRIWHFKSLRPACRALIDELCEGILARNRRAHRRADPMASRAEAIVEFLGLDETARDVLTYSIVRALTPFRDYPVRCHTFTETSDFCAMAIDRPRGDVARALGPDAPLRRFEVLDPDGDFHAGPFRDFLESGSDTILESRFYKRASLDDALPLSYHGDLATRHAPLLKALLSAPAGNRAPNILFYGPPGTGKTSFAKTLARELGLDLVEVLQGDTRGQISTSARLTGLRVCQERMPAGRAIVLVDEADSLLNTAGGFMGVLFGGSGKHSTPKGVLNSALDEAQLPSIWIANTPAEALDESVRRRFDYSIRFEALDAARRLVVWQNSVERFGLGRVLPPEAVRRLSERYPANAGGIANALGNVKRLRISRARAEKTVAALLEPHCELLGIPVRDETSAAASDYSVEGLNIAGDLSPANIVAAVRKFRDSRNRADDPDRPRFNLLLSGPPGTGKTEFVRHLARETGARLTLLTGSSLLGAYVGETESNIRDAFREAESTGAILFLDEMDGLLMERQSANHRWELTQVNELLHAMENFNGVFVGATNFTDRLDQAVLRRFTLKLRFDYLNPAGKRLFFERMFKKASLSPEEAVRLAAIPNLAPGDFRTVRQSLFYLGEPPTAARCLAALEHESALKRGAATRTPLGFTP